MGDGLPVFDARQFARWVGGEPQSLPESFCGVTQDTRRLVPGNLYVAVRGERMDGHAFVGQALAAGAAAALVDDGWQSPEAGWPLIRVRDTLRALGDAARAWRLASRARVVGLTGSSGKTTTKEMTAALLAAAGPVWATPGNYNNEVGLPLSVLGLGTETAFGVFEAGMNHPGEIARLAAVMRPDVAVVTSIGPAHIEHFGTLEAIAEEKGALLRAVPPDGLAVLSLETACYDRLRACVTGRLVTVSQVTREADYYGELLEPCDGVLRVTVCATGASCVLRSGLPGAYNASNLLLAFAVAHESGVAPDAAARALRELALPGMRWERHERGGVRVVNDAYNANPSSMAAVLEAFMRLPCDGRRVLVLGDMRELGALSESYHRELGRHVARLAPEALFAVGCDACGYLAEEAVRAGYPALGVRCCADAAEAAVAVKGYVAAGDSVLLKASRAVRLERILDEL